MPSLIRTLCLGLTLAIAVTANAADDAKPAKGKKGANGQANAVFAIPKEITLSAEQQSKIDEIKKEQGPKVAELTTKLDSVLTAEQKSAQKEANAKNKADGKKGKEAKAAVDEALKLTDEQKKQQSELQPELTKLQRSIKEQINGVLTDEQKTHYKVPKAKKVK